MPIQLHPLFPEVSTMWRYPYDGKALAVSRKVAVDCSESRDMAQQGPKKETDINEIVRKFGITGQLPVGRARPQYGDFTGVEDYQSALNQLIMANQAFASLSAEVRDRFGNDPAKLWAFVNSGEEKDLAEARKLGILAPEEPERPPQKVEVVNPSPPPEVKL